MSKVIQVRDVPDEVHAALVAAAKADGVSLTAFLLRHFDRMASERADWEYNAEIIREAQQAIGVAGTREGTVDALDEGRGERGAHLDGGAGSHGRASA